jgi:SAM-dependent methyltransferase
MTSGAVERIDIEEARRSLPESARWVDAILLRLQPWLDGVDRPLRILDVGAAQGRSLIALAHRGHQAAGVEPWEKAVVVANELAAEEGVEIDIRVGQAEAIPFPDDTFDIVIATSVMEHVADLDRSLREIRRVLVDGGMFWFNCASAVSPRQSEIRRFPLFPWYPGPLKRRIMRWAVAEHPELVGGTEWPAVNWLTPRSARRHLHAAGFVDVVDRWHLRHASELGSGPARTAVDLCRRFAPARFVGDVIVPNCAYLALVGGRLPPEVEPPESRET